MGECGVFKPLWKNPTSTRPRAIPFLSVRRTRRLPFAPQGRRFQRRLGGTREAIGIGWSLLGIRPARRLLSPSTARSRVRPRGASGSRCLPVTISCAIRWGWRQQWKHGTAFGRRSLNPAVEFLGARLSIWGGSSLKGPPESMAGGRTLLAGQSSSFESGQEVTGLAAWALDCLAVLRALRLWWSGFRFGPATGGCMARGETWFTNPDVDHHRGGGRGTQRPHSPLAPPPHKRGALAAKSAGLRASWASGPLPQVGPAFDNRFSTAPWSRLLFTYAVPESGAGRGLRRFRFHGLNHQAHQARWVRPSTAIHHSVRPELDQLPPGPCCSLAGGFRDGRSIDTTMGYNPLEGLVMASRSGSVDPGLLLPPAPPPA